MWIRLRAGAVAVLRVRVPVVHLMEQFAAPSTLSVRRLSQRFFQRYMPLSGFASARLIQECGGAAADYAHPALQWRIMLLAVSAPGR